VDAKFNPELFACAREAAGLTQHQLAQTLGVSQGKVSKLEAGLLQPDEALLVKAATLLRCTEAFFSSESPRFHLSPVLHRKQQKLGVKALKGIHARLRRRRIEVGRLLEATEIESSLPHIDANRDGWSPQRVAQELRILWQMPRGAVASVTQLLEDAGVVVVPVDFATDTIAGLSTPMSDGTPPMVFVSTTVPGDRQRFTLAHELGHLVMHFHDDRFLDDEFEAEADQFAAEFLAPASDIRGHLSRLSLQQAAQLKSHWGIAIQAVIRRARDLDQISDHRYTMMMKDISMRGWRKNEPVQVPREAPALFAEIVETHMKELGYSPEQLAQLMFLPVDEFRALFSLPDAAPKAPSPSRPLQVVKP
jgi:Zn-dependent peptidase ImmA (M78 family)/DNA-binding XRE family transcriptional regulator